MDKRTKYTRRSAIVRQFVAGLADNTEQQICRLYQVGFDDGEVRRRLHISMPKLALLKLKLSLGMKKAGIQPGA